MKKTFISFIKIFFISLSLTLIGFIIPLSIANGKTDLLMRVLFLSGILISAIIAILFFYIEEKKNNNKVLERKRSFNHNKRVEKSLDYYSVANNISENGSKIISIFDAA